MHGMTVHKVGKLMQKCPAQSESTAIFQVLERFYLSIREIKIYRLPKRSEIKEKLDSTLIGLKIACIHLKCLGFVHLDLRTKPKYFIITLFCNYY